MLTHPQCGNSCKLQSYLDIIEPLIPVDWKKECQLNFDDDLDDHISISNDDDHDEKHAKIDLKHSLSEDNDDWFTAESSCLMNPSRK